MILYCFLIFTLPLMNQRQLALRLGGLTLEKWLGLLCFAYALLCAARRGLRPGLWRSGQARAFLGFYCVAAVSFALLGRPAPDSMMLVYSSQLLFLATTLILVDSLAALRWALLAAISSLALGSLYLIRDWWTGSALWGLSYRPGFVVGDANYFTAGAVLLLPLAFLFFADSGSRWERAYCSGVVVLTLLAIMLGASRGGFLGLVVAFVLMCWSSRHRWRNLACATAVLVLLSAAVPRTPLERFVHPSGGDQESSQDRLALWQAGLAMFTAHPWSGVGLGNFKQALADYAPPGTDLNFIAHNTYIEMAAEMGWPGLVAFLLILLATDRALARARHVARSRGAELTLCAATGLRAGLAGFLVAAFFLSAAFLKQLWFAVFISACLPHLADLEAGAGAEAPLDDTESLAAPACSSGPAPVRPRKVRGQARHHAPEGLL